MPHIDTPIFGTIVTENVEQIIVSLVLPNCGTCQHSTPRSGTCPQCKPLADVDCVVCVLRNIPGVPVATEPPAVPPENP